MADEGWENPLDWIHLDDFIMKHNLGFRPGHIQIFNRKFDLWVKKYNEVRRTIPVKQKGKDGTLIVGPGEVKILKSNYNYEFTKVNDVITLIFHSRLPPPLFWFIFCVDYIRLLFVKMPESQQELGLQRIKKVFLLTLVPLCFTMLLM